MYLNIVACIIEYYSYIHAESLVESPTALVFLAAHLCRWFYFRQAWIYPEPLEWYDRNAPRNTANVTWPRYTHVHICTYSWCHVNIFICIDCYIISQQSACRSTCVLFIHMAWGAHLRFRRTAGWKMPSLQNDHGFFCSECLETDTDEFFFSWSFADSWMNGLAIHSKKTDRRALEHLVNPSAHCTVVGTQWIVFGLIYSWMLRMST